MEVMLAQEGGVQKGVRITRVDQRLDGNRRLTGHEYVDQQGEMARNGEGEGSRKRKSASQPGIPTGWDVHFLAKRCQKWCEGKG